MRVHSAVLNSMLSYRTQLARVSTARVSTSAAVLIPFLVAKLYAHRVCRQTCHYHHIRQSNWQDHVIDPPSCQRHPCYTRSQTLSRTPLLIAYLHPPSHPDAAHPQPTRDPPTQQPSALSWLEVDSSKAERSHSASISASDISIPNSASVAPFSPSKNISSTSSSSKSSSPPCSAA